VFYWKWQALTITHKGVTIFSQYTSLLHDDIIPNTVLGHDRLNQLAIDLAKSLKLLESCDKTKNLVAEVKHASKDLLRGYLFLTTEILSQTQTLTPASEWFLDNFHIIEDQMRIIKRDLPKDFYNELPKISEGEFAGHPRVYAIAYTYVNNTDARLELRSIENFVMSFQGTTPLTIGELWAIAITFRISLIRRLQPLVERIIFSRKKRQEADQLSDNLLELATRTTTTPETLVSFLAQSLRQKDKFNRPFIVQLIQRLRDQDPKIALAFDWLENALKSCGTTTSEIVNLEHYRQAAAQATIGNIISSMRLLEKIDWHDFFEAVSIVNPILNQDPARVYAHMTKATKDSYRKVIERISKRSNYDEIKVAQKAIDMAKSHKDRQRHVGYFLIDNGIFLLERELNYKVTIKEKFIRFIDQYPSAIYFSSLVLLTISFCALIFHHFQLQQFNIFIMVAIWLLILIPTSELSLSVINYFISTIRKPKMLPRMETDQGISKDNASMVVVPCLLSSPTIITELINSLEVQFLANQDSNIYFALLGDLPDADSEVAINDQNLLALTYQGIEDLNRRYKKDLQPQFYFFHRIRLFNSSENKWIGWERKRGKIEEFNRLLRGDQETSYIDNGTDFQFLQQIQYVITLDADTQLPLQNARRLIGTIIHPLNQPIYDKERNCICAGYAILQPRVSVSLISANKTRFAHIFSGNTGIDPYTTAVSDVYQDLFQEGSFTGKGLYVVDAFAKVMNGRIPANTVLSHDLLEGSYARVGLTSDLELIDDFPSNFATFTSRNHRWTRGDWQIAWWLFPYVRDHNHRWQRNHLSLLARWKIFDNLRRSLLAPSLLLWFTLSWSILPADPTHWTLTILIMMGFPVYVPSLRDFFHRRQDVWTEHLKFCYLEIRKRLAQVILMVIFMPAIAIAQCDAIIRSLFRMMISKKHLLEWVTFSQTEFKKSSKFGFGEFMANGPAFACFVLALVFTTKPNALVIALPFIVVWGLAPILARWTSKRARAKIKNLSGQEVQAYRRYARMTWRFFEKFANAENNWLAPDNFQEDPKPVVACRTSPTNIGLHFCSILSAYDMGYIGCTEMIELIEKAINSLEKLQKMKGHFFNWYDTIHLKPLHPKYISVVDSGNLACFLIVLKQAALKHSQGPYTNDKYNLGLNDTFLIIIEKITKMQQVSNLPMQGSYNRIVQHLEDLCANVHLYDWIILFEKIQRIENLLLELEPDRENEIYVWLNCARNQIQSYQADESQSQSELSTRWRTIAIKAHTFFMAMDFSFLFDQERKIFSIGYNATENRKDDSYYDLLASESRLASLFAIAKGDVPAEHWFRLGRQLTPILGSRALISWSATMFEYLMPLLVMKRYEDTLLDQTYDSVVLRQIEYGEQRNVPWGISEAGYNARDLNFNYQYGPFGVPGLGLKRGLRDELVISPYSTMLAAMVIPSKALQNLLDLEKIGAHGNYGFYEALDYTSERLPKNKKFVILKSFMAHHQGMSLVALNNLLNDSIMQKRFHAESRIKAVQILLQERIPKKVHIAKPRAEETHTEHYAHFSKNHQVRTYNDPSLSTPRTHILSNGNYSVMMSTAGSGYSKCEDLMLTRWKEDPTQDNYGQFIYIQNIHNQKCWSVGFQPIESKYQKYEAHFSEDKIEIDRIDYGINTHTEVIVSSEDNVELRKILLTNNTDNAVELEITSYMEVALAQLRDDAAHPAFSNLFVQTQFIPKSNAILANRRHRNPNEKELWALHLITSEAKTVGPLQYETDRSRFLGRGRTAKNPIVMTNEIELTNTTGAVLDPIFSLRQRVIIEPHQSAKLIFVTGLVYSYEEALRVIDKYHEAEIFQRQANLGWVKGQIGLRHLNISMEKAHLYQRLAGRILYLAPYLRVKPEVLKTNNKTQSALWAYGISGDLPILMTRIHSEKDMEMIRELLRAYEYLRLKGLKIDLVILNDHQTSYLQNLHDELTRQILISGLHPYLDKPGGIFIRRADLISAEDLTLLKSIARLCLFADNGKLADQLRRRPHEPEMPARFIASRTKKDYPKQNIILPELLFNNGLGGFSLDHKEYLIYLQEDQWTPAPWINVVANQKDFGFVISEAGQGYTWSVNSRENRLSPWSNDAISDHTSEALYIRDEESGEFWTPTPLPIKSREAYLVRHGQGYTKFEHISHGIDHKMSVFVPLEDSVKIIRLKLSNLSDKDRKLSVTGYIEWVLGFARYQTAQTIYSFWDENSASLLSKNSYNNEFAHRIAFISTNQTPNSFTCDRKEFIGRNGNLSRPAAMVRSHLSNKIGGGFDPCGAIQSIFILKKNEEKEIIILIGQGEDEEEARSLSLFYKNIKNVETAFMQVKDYWDHTLSAITIKTPDSAMNLLTNRWLLYQTLACRIWARSAFYQSGGAFGYRDQLQDVMAMIYTRPQITRDHILLAASRQFPEGDVQHWWHPPTGRGVRTRFSDDLLWLPFVTNYYIEVTGDTSILDEVISFIETPLLKEGHDETYTQPTISDQSATLYEHCFRAIDRSLKVGVHGLPLMGSGDWNDGMSRVGHKGKGESVWLAWFLMKTIREFIPLCELKNDNDRSKDYREHLHSLKNSVENHAWDGQWYLRAYFDNGDKMGSHENEECKIDAIAQSWSLISGEGDPQRSLKALESVDKYLINRDEQIIKLFTPPFDKGNADPGYIKGYVPGVRENGGQYTHAAIWTMMAYAKIGDGKTATELFSLINPINRTSNRTGTQKYKVEPYVISADIYGVDPHIGRGGWSWYTGSASWMYRAAIESICGLRVNQSKLSIKPCIPKEWSGFELIYRHGSSRYHISIFNNQNEENIFLNGIKMKDQQIILKDDGKTNLVTVKLKGV
jgi:cyclic beta-1,2-glucan synthetase